MDKKAAATIMSRISPFVFLALFQCVNVLVSFSVVYLYTTGILSFFLAKIKL